jgi:hypothetical protein
MSPIRRRSARLAKTAPPVKSDDAASHLDPVAEEEPQTQAPTVKKSKPKRRTKVPVPTVREPEPEEETTPAEPAMQPKATESPTKSLTTERPAINVPPTPVGKPSLNPIPSTPLNSSAIKPPRSEMHPSKVPHVAHTGLHLGFADLQPATLDAARTPTKIGPLTSPLKPPTSPFTFRSSSHQDEMQIVTDEPVAPQLNQTGLSSAALEMMDSLRGEAAKIRAELARKQAAEEHENAVAAAAQSDRKIAHPRGRYSAAHQTMFDKMKSIENHPSAWRLNRANSRPDQDAAAQAAAAKPDVPKSLKRTQSKANLHEDDAAPKDDAAAPKTSSGSAATPSLLNRSSSKAGQVDKPASAIPTLTPKSLKRTRSKANLVESKEAATPKQAPAAQPVKTPTTAPSRIPAPGFPVKSTVKRLKARFEDDASSSRPKTDEDTTPTGRPRAVGGAIPRTPAGRSMIAKANYGSLSRPAATSTLATPTSRLRQPSAAPAIAAGSQTEKINKTATPSRLTQIKSMLQSRIVEACSGNTQKPKQSVPDVKTGAAPEPTPAQETAETSKAQADVLPTLPSVPTTTPSRSLLRKMLFTPKTERAVMSQQSPTPMKMGPARANPEAAATPAVAATPAEVAKAATSTPAAAAVAKPAATPATVIKTRPAATPVAAIKAKPKAKPAATPITAVKTKTTPQTATKRPTLRHVTYPDLSKYAEINDPTPERPSAPEPKESRNEGPAKTPIAKAPTPSTPKTAAASVPGTFAFRTDHTISFEQAATQGFGATRGQASIRQVRLSVLPASIESMPGAFPTVSSDKENSQPSSPSPIKMDATEALSARGMPHGLQSKKRARATWEEEEAEVKKDEERRAAKKQRAAHPSGGELFTAPRAANPASSPTKKAPKTPINNNQPGTARKKPFMSISRLNMLAQPKNRR